jgi:site-specific DNA recombinase
VQNVLMVRYRRVSTEDQKDKGFSLPEQTLLCDQKIEQLRQELEAKGQVVNIQVVDFEDTMGGDILNRPVLEQVREFVVANRPDYFVCLDPDRFSRSLAFSLLVKDEIEAVGTQLVFVQHNYEKSAEGQMFYQFRGAIAQYEKAKILERTKRGMKGKLRQGKLPYHVNIYGYDYDKQVDTLVVNENEAQWVRQVFEWSAGGMGPLEIRTRLNDMGVPAKKGGPWYTSSIRSLLKNTSYAGEMRCNRYNWEGMTSLMQLPKERRNKPIRSTMRPEEDWIIVPVPPVIDQDLFDQVQNGFRTLKRRAKRGAGVLSGIATCGLCGGAIHYVPHKQHGYVLRCINKYPSSRETLVPVAKCSLPYVKASLIEDKVWAEITEWVLNPDRVLEALRHQTNNDEATGQLTRSLASITAIEAAIQTKRQEQATTIRNQSKGLIDEVVADQLLTEAKREIDRLSSRLATTKKELADLQGRVAVLDTFEKRLSSISEQIGFTQERLKHGFEVTTPEERQRMIRHLVQEVKCLPGKDCKVLPIE